MNTKWVSGLMLVSMFTSIIIQPVIGVTTASETVMSEEQLVTSDNMLETSSNDGLLDPVETSASEDERGEESQELVEEEQDEEIHVENNYDERDLSKKDEANGAQPVVQVEIDQERLQGEIHLSAESNEESKTILEKVVLQMKAENADWQEVAVFDNSKDHVLNENLFSFEYQGLTEEQAYRLVVDYVIEEPKGEQAVLRTVHKGQVLFETPAAPSESVSDTQDSAENEEVETPQDDDFIGPNVPQSEPVTAEDLSGSVSRAVNDVLYEGSQNSVSTYVKIYDIKAREASIEFKHQTYASTGNTRYAVWSTDPNRIVKLCANVSTSSQLSKALWTELKADGTNVVMPYKTHWSVAGGVLYGPGKMTNLLPNTTYYVWLFSVPASEINTVWSHPAGTYTLLDKSIRTPYVFKTDSAAALTITAPTFTQASATHNSVPMVGKAYAGDIFQTSGQGKVQVTSNDGTTVQDKVTNLGHTTTVGGTYNNATVSGLTAGTRYKGRTALKDYGGTWRYSPWSSYFYTANTVNQPAAPTLNTPSAANNATAAVNATYNVGDVAAHPTAVEVQASTNGSSWSTLSTTTTPATTTPTITTGSKNVSFTLSKLNARTKYYVRYRVRNASNVWSGYSTSREFTTGAMSLSIGTPTFTQTTATHNAIYMTGTTYTGDIFQTSGQGKVQVTPDDGTTIQDKVTNLTHTVSRGGTYHNITVPNLVAGTRYKGRVAIKDYGGTWRYSGWSAYFYTANTVNQPTVPSQTAPTTANNATAQVSATYNVGNVAAHPTATDIVISTNNTDWITVTADTTPAVTNRVFNTNNNTVTFDLTKLNSKTTYYVKYRVRNASNVWSGFSTSKGFTTGGISLVVSPPVFDQSTATATSIQMKQGTYTGDISQTGNQGEVYSESFNNGTDNDWTRRVSNLAHTTTTNGTYSAAQIDGLTPGTRYRGTLRFKNAEDNYIAYVGQPNGAEHEFFYTTNIVSELSVPTLNTPVAENDATAEFWANYQAAGDHPDQPAAHPNEVKIYLSTDGVSFTDISTSSSAPAIESYDIDTTNKKILVKIKNLNANQTYHVKCSVVNQGGESEQTTSKTFTTNLRQAGLYISDVPPVFNFGVQSVGSTLITAPLINSQGTNDFGIKMENVDINSNWSFGARLSPLQTQDGSNQELTGAAISFSKELQKTTDGVNWSTVTQDFVGLSESTVLLPSDSSTVRLWQTTDISAGQGKFKTNIGFDSVRLIVPGNIAQKGNYYEGKIEWLMVSEP